MKILTSLLTGIVILMNYPALAQTSLNIYSSETNQPLPYASVVNHTKQQLYFCNENGLLEHGFGTGDSISISYVGYFPYHGKINGKESFQIMLQPDKRLLSEVVLKPCSNWINAAFDNLAGDSSGRTFGGLHWIENSLNAKVAVLLESYDDRSYLENFSFWLEKINFGNQSSYKAPIKFSFYKVIDSTGLPGDLIVAKQVIYLPKKTGKQTIQSDSLLIRIPENGMYIAFEIPFDKKYAHRVKVLTEGNNEGQIHNFYGGQIQGVFSRKNILVFYDYLQNNWHFAINRTKDDMYKTHGTIKFAYTVKSCAD